MAANEDGKAAAAKDNKTDSTTPAKDVKPDQKAPSPQTAVAPQSQPADDDDDFRVIEDKPASKSITIPTPPGLQENNLRRHEIYTRVVKKAKDEVVAERRSAEEAEQSQSEKETQASETDKKPPRF